MSIWARHWTGNNEKRCRVWLNTGPIRSRHDQRGGRQSTARNPGKDAEFSHTGGVRPSNDFRNGGGSAKNSSGSRWRSGRRGGLRSLADKRKKNSVAIRENFKHTCQQIHTFSRCAFWNKTTAHRVINARTISHAKAEDQKSITSYKHGDPERICKNVK